MLYAAYYAVRYIWSRKLRSFLTVLGIAVGVAAIVSLLAISEGMEAQVIARAEVMGINNMIVSPMAGGVSFDEDDLAYILEIEHVDTATLIYTASGQVPPHVRKRAERLSKEVRGIETASSVTLVSMDLEALQRIVTLEMQDGGYPTTRLGTTLGARIARGLVSSSNKLEGVGGRLQLARVGAGQGSKGKAATLKIEGVLAEVGRGFDIGFTVDNSALVSVETFKKVTGDPSPTAGLLVIRGDDFENVDLVVSSVEAYFTSRDKQVNVKSAKSLVDSQQQEMYTMQIFLGSIGAIALVAGCIGAINTVLTSVLERTKEIGMMKAVGASYNYILMLFILESAVLGVLGGITGNFIAIGVSSALSGVLGGGSSGMLRRLGSGAVISNELMVFGFLVGLSSSLLAGYYPAKQAAKMDTITALRY
ncbi:MAG: ABC transporter permease [Candidatus Undinarchaeales archaeon]|nr:ABC transporter permease [Candidatus Undinarchaeales archaeon]